MTFSRNNSPDSSSVLRPKVYVVDDEPMLLELAVLILNPLGLQFETFRDPRKALEAFTRSERKPDLLITDFAMDGMNGMELIHECRRVHPSQRILLVSGTVGTEVFEGAEQRPDKFLAKPYHSKQLVDLVQDLIGPECGF